MLIRTVVFAAFWIAPVGLVALLTENLTRQATADAKGHRQSNHPNSIRVFHAPTLAPAGILNGMRKSAIAEGARP